MSSCRYVDGCPIFKYFKTKFASTIYLTQYCEGDYAKCRRYQMRLKGQVPPESLLPDGKELTEHHIKG